MNTIPHIILLPILLAATATDLSSRKIPNLLTFPAMLLGLGWHLAATGGDGLVFALSGLGLGLGLMLPAHLAGVMGAGDVKLMAACGALLGPGLVLDAFLLTCLAGGAYALAVLAANPSLFMRAMANLRRAAMLMPATGRFDYARADRTRRLPRLCYGLAISIGTALAMLFNHLGLDILPL